MAIECAAQHRQFVFDIEHLKDICDDYPDGTQCPICVSVSISNTCIALQNLQASVPLWALK